MSRVQGVHSTDGVMRKPHVWQYIRTGVYTLRKNTNTCTVHIQVQNMYMYILCTHEKLMLSVFNVSGRGVFFTFALLITPLSLCSVATLHAGPIGKLHVFNAYTCTCVYVDVDVHVLRSLYVMFTQVWISFRCLLV